MATEVRMALPLLRSQRGLSQRQLAALAGLRPDTISAIERGQSAGVKFATIARLCEVLDCEPGDLFEIEIDEHQVPVLGGPDEDDLIRARLAANEPRIDGPTFVKELLRQVGRRPTREKSAR